MSDFPPQPSNEKNPLGTFGGGIAGFLVGAFFGAVLLLGLHGHGFPLVVWITVPAVAGGLGYWYGDRFHLGILWVIRWIRWVP